MEQKPLAVITHGQLAFKSHICNILKKPCQKLNAPKIIQPIWNKLKEE